jgi:hypothetical protein
MNPGSERQKGDIAEWVVKVEGEGRGKGVCVHASGPVPGFAGAKLRARCAGSGIVSPIPPKLRARWALRAQGGQ